MIRYVLVIIFFLHVQTVSAQQKLQVIRANSKNVRILDGLNYKPNFWVIFPDIKPDIYYLDLPRKETLVKFATDIDSISFNMTYGEVKDFIVLLNGVDSCYTRVSANYPNLKIPKKLSNDSDTIPFTMRNNRIYFTGKINNSAPLNIQFDLGADAVCLNKKSVDKIRINFDKKGTLVNSDGTNETRVSSKNEIELAGLNWSGIEIYETNNMKNYEDAIVGNSFFLDQIYKIDYDKRLIIIYKKLPEMEANFVKQDMILDNGVRPVIEGSFIFDDTLYKDWFLFDTGNTGNGIIGSSYIKENNLNDKFSTIMGFGSKKAAYFQGLMIAEEKFVKVVFTVEKEKKAGSEYKFGGLFGNNLLKCFHVIIDNQEGAIYMKPNLFFSKYHSH